MVKCVHYEVCCRAKNGDPSCDTCKNYSDGIHGPENVLLRDLEAIRDDLCDGKYIDSNDLKYALTRAILVIGTLCEYATATSVADKVLAEKRSLWEKALREMSEGDF